MTTSAADRQRIEEWLTSSGSNRQPFLVLGPARCGKSELIKAAAERIDGALLLDCAGLTADEVARRIVTETGGNLTPPGRRWPRHVLHTEVRGDHILLLTNVQWAGVLATSSEPSRIGRDLMRQLLWAPRASLRMAVEWDPDLLGAPPSISTTITLAETEGSAATAGSPQDHSLAARALHALSCSELPITPLPVWQLLVAAVDSSGILPDESDLHRIVSGFPEILVFQDGPSGGPGVSFRHPSLRQRQRRSHPAGQEQQARIMEMLTEYAGASGPGRAWHSLGEVGRYVAKALPVHAALAGSLERTLAQGAVLANMEASSLWDALRIAFPDGVPPRSVAADIRALEWQGVQPADQGEWVSWLHHVALSSGRTEVARQLLESGVTIPWRTMWSRWRPSGIFGGHEGEVGRVDEIGLRSGPDAGLCVLTARDITTGKAALPEFSYVLREWAVTTGDAAGEEMVIDESLDEADWVFDERAPDDVSAVFATHSPSGWHVEDAAVPPPPRVPAAVRQGVLVDGMWVLAGDGGLFAVSVPPSELDVRPMSWLPEPLVTEHVELTVPQLPADARSAARGDTSSRFWFERNFGLGACHPLSAGDIPHGLENERARRFLIDIGLPVVEDFLHLRTHSLQGSSLRAEPWPPNAKVSTPGTDGPFFDIGVWMHSRLLLDGGTGQILRDTTRGPDTLLASSGLPQFFTMVRLFNDHRKAMYPSWADRQDWHRILREWCREIDPAALEGEVWDIVLGPYDFEDSTWDLVSSDGRFP
ncbi:SUKH-4 family immunity protein [Streptomyces sp. NBC_01728]|uniref:SUKH-4 family immunity protein n=1 Tax=unclassified Streptomyces TaxID=2593676 RepID=UPI00225746A3|nr:MULTISPECIES: SUKH-4 family immunity protein [unclassified Streptomyces]MCX4457248.1 SUKH-4 family immunity protein [Streptomyces sp. NBC_01719]MCX4496605.1 SUKH-4 family immunity protein [Streptomyces sp. NBC_01728]